MAWSSYENIMLLAFDLFACIIAMRIDAGPLLQRFSCFGYQYWQRWAWLPLALLSHAT
jgi:hypothetical protein